jgi:hypothetical protein
MSERKCEYLPLVDHELTEHRAALHQARILRAGRKVGDDVVRGHGAKWK